MPRLKRWLASLGRFSARIVRRIDTKSKFADSSSTFVVATVHLDRADGCGVGPRLFGFSQLAERRLGARIAAGLGWRVRADHVALGNAEPLRRDPNNPQHVWLGDGLATTIAVP